MFESLSDRFEGIFTRLRGRGRLSPEDVDEALREIRMALLQADVNLLVVRDVVARLRQELVGVDLSQSLTPGQQVVKAVNNELVRILGGTALKITYASRPPTVVLMAGLQGSGKTTNCGQAGPLVQATGPQPPPGRGRPSAPGGCGTAEGPRLARSASPCSPKPRTRSRWPKKAWPKRCGWAVTS